MRYQKLFNYMSKEHGVTLLETDMQEICNIVNEIQDEALRQPPLIDSFTMQDLMLYYQDKKGLDFTSKVVDVLNCMVNDR